MNLENYDIQRISSRNHKIKFKNKIYNIQKSNSAIFFDRDGVLIEDMHYIADPKDVKILSGVKNLLKKSKNEGYLNIVISNQSGISRGLLNWNDYLKVTSKMIKLLGKESHIDAIYANSNSPNEIFFEGSWRKPSPNMILEAVKEFNIDLKKSFLVGDRFSDLLSAKNAGLEKFVHVLTGHGEKERESVLNNFRKDYESNKLLVLDNLSGLELNLIFEN